MGMWRNLIFFCGISGFALSGGWAEEEKAFLYSPLAEAPEWRLLDSYQGMIRREDFFARCRSVFDPSGALAKYLSVDDE